MGSGHWGGDKRKVPDVVSLARDTPTVRVELVEDYDFGLEGGDCQEVAVTGDL